MNDAMVFWTAVGAIATVLAFGLALLVFWLNFANRVSEAKLVAEKAQGAADIATDKADAAIRSAAEIHNRFTTEQAAMGIYRESIAREYVRRDVLREMEERIMAAVRDAVGQSTAAFNSLSERIDKALSERPARTR
jgi:hypothetical protein